MTLPPTTTTTKVTIPVYYPKEIQVVNRETFTQEYLLSLSKKKDRGAIKPQPSPMLLPKSAYRNSTCG